MFSGKLFYVSIFKSLENNIHLFTFEIYIFKFSSNIVNLKRIKISNLTRDAANKILISVEIGIKVALSHGTVAGFG